MLYRSTLNVDGILLIFLVIVLRWNSRPKLQEKPPTGGNTEDVKIAVPLKYCSIFWRSFQMPLINCEIDLILSLSWTCVITNLTTGSKQTFLFLRLEKITKNIFFLLVNEMITHKNCYKKIAKYLKKTTRPDADPTTI